MRVRPWLIPPIAALFACSGVESSTPAFGQGTPTHPAMGTPDGSGPPGTPPQHTPPQRTPPQGTGPEGTLPDGTPRANPTPAPGTVPAANLTIVECTVSVADLPTTPQVSITSDGEYRYITGNGLPNHAVGAFPNPHNPNEITVQSVDYRVPMSPSGAGSSSILGPLGVAINGIKFDPGANEFWQGDRESGWQYEPLGGGRDLGVDCNFAHVQPDGSYHYHGMPQGLLNALGGGVQMFFVGYASDGYPIYAKYGYADPNDEASPVRIIVSSYKLKDGTRPDGPGGEYDGTFVQDFEFVPFLGDLDECNGRTGVTPDFGMTYHYFLTDNFPYIPRCTKATPDATFAQAGPPGGGAPAQGRQR